MTRYWFITSQSNRGEKLAFYTFVLALGVILLGAYTRLTDAGLSCPDWPNCFGYLTAPHTENQLQEAAKAYPNVKVNVTKAWTEMIHRYAAGIEGLLILFLAYVLFKSQTQQNKTPALIGFFLVVLLNVQVILGMLTVTEKLKPLIVLSHLLTGLSLLSILWWANLTFQPIKSHAAKYSRTEKLERYLWIGLIIIVLQITLGGLVSSHYAGLACIDFPFCNGVFLPELSFDNSHLLVTLHIFHRLGAYLTAIYFSALAIYLIYYNIFRKIAFLVLLFIIAQITLGILNILWLRPVSIALGHHLVAILLLLSTLTLLVKIKQINRDQKYG